MTDRFIRERECQRTTGLSRTTRWRLERDGRFPSRRRISPNAIAWLESEVQDWLRMRAEDGEAAARRHSTSDDGTTTDRGRAVMKAKGEARR